LKGLPPGKPSLLGKKVEKKKKKGIIAAKKKYLFRDTMRGGSVSPEDTSGKKKKGMPAGEKKGTGGRGPLSGIFLSPAPAKKEDGSARGYFLEKL